MNAVQLGFPKAVAEAHGSRPKAYASSYAMVQSIEQKLRGSGPDIDYHAEKQRESMKQLMNKFSDCRNMSIYQAKNGTSVRTIPYDGLKTSMPLNMVTVCNDMQKGGMSGSGLRYENQKLGKDLLSKRAKQLGEQQMGMEGAPVPTMEDMERRMAGPSEAELEKAITAPSELAMDEILFNYDSLLDGLETGLIGQSSFEYVRKIVMLIKKQASILSRSDFDRLIDLSQDALELTRAYITEKVPDNPRMEFNDVLKDTRTKVERALEPALERLIELLAKLSDVADFASDKERRQAIASTLRDAGLEGLKETKTLKKASLGLRPTKRAEKKQERASKYLPVAIQALEEEDLLNQ